MSKALITNSTLTDIADAIRAKGGTSAAMLPSAMPAAIEAIPSGGDEPQGGWVNDGNTHLWITSDSSFQTFYISIKDEGNQNVVVRWGDGNSSTVGSGNVHLSHNYSQPGDYRIDIEGTTPTLIGMNDYYGILFQHANAKTENCSFAEIGTSVTHLKRTFQVCYYLRSVKLSSSNVVLTGTFENCVSLTKVINIDNVTDVGANTFYGCYLLKSALFNNVLSFGNNAFRGCQSIEKVSVTSGITSIGSACFYGIKSLKEIRFPETLTSIGANAFMYVNGVGCDYYIDAVTPPTIESTTLSTAMISHIYVPSGSVDTYKAATNWSSIANKIYAKPE